MQLDEELNEEVDGELDELEQAILQELEQTDIISRVREWSPAPGRDSYPFQVS